MKSNSVFFENRLKYLFKEIALLLLGSSARVILNSGTSYTSNKKKLFSHPAGRNSLELFHQLNFLCPALGNGQMHNRKRSVDFDENIEPLRKRLAFSLSSLNIVDNAGDMSVDSNSRPFRLKDFKSDPSAAGSAFKRIDFSNALKRHLRNNFLDDLTKSNSWRCSKALILWEPNPWLSGQSPSQREKSTTSDTENSGMDIG